MRTGFLIPKMASGGAERAISAIANEFSKKGENVEIITFDSSESFYQLEDNIKIFNMELKEISLSHSLKRALSCVKRAHEIRKNIKSRQYDVLVCMSTSMNTYGLISTAFTKTKVVGTERNNPYKYLSDKINATLKKTSALFLDGFIFQTKAASEYYAESVRKKGVIIQNAVFNPLAKEIKPAEKREKIIYGLGRFYPQKRFQDLIDAFALFEKTHPDYRLVIFGEGIEREMLQKKINSYNLSEKISLPGVDKEALKYISTGSAFVLTSEYEGMPNALMEAMAVGTPCVSVRCKMGPEELIENGVNGILVDEGDVEKIKEGIETVVDNPALSQKISENCRNIIKTNDIAAISEKWLEYLKDINIKES